MAFTTRQLSALNLDELRTYLGDRDCRSLAYNTWVSREGRDIVICFHSTDILKFHEDDTFTVDTGGWQTVTTKQRLNALLPAGYRIYSERFRWFMTTPSGDKSFSDGFRWGTPVAQPTAHGWCCVDCLMLIANGETPTELDEAATKEWVANVDARTAGFDITLGLTADEHDDGCPNVKDGRWIGGADCWCERQEFSWRTCDVCGSSLGGERHAVTFWERNHAA